MKYTKPFVFIGLWILTLTSTAQTPILHEEKVDELYRIPKLGPNRSRFAWLQLSLFGTDISTHTQDTKGDFSHYYGADFYHKFKVNSICSHGYSVGAHRQVFRLNSQGLDRLTAEAWDKGKVVMWGLHAQYFWRFNFDPSRGNTTGWYVDVAAVGQFNFFQKQQYERDDVHEKIRGGLIAERYAIAGEIRVGREAFSLYIRYKAISEACKKSESPITQMNLPAFSIGLNIGIFVL